LLWHGTRDTDPKIIYEGQEAFDAKYSREGMWGIGLYFAVNSSYSLNWSHKPSNGLKGMFLAEVNLGDVCDLSTHKSEYQKLVVPKDGKDSVKGFTGGSEIYIVYANKKVYPKYYITYTA
jgi:hypothetical protein